MWLLEWMDAARKDIIFIITYFGVFIAALFSHAGLVGEIQQKRYRGQFPRWAVWSYNISLFFPGVGIILLLISAYKIHPVFRDIIGLVTFILPPLVLAMMQQRLSLPTPLLWLSRFVIAAYTYLGFVMGLLHCLPR